MFGLPHTPFLCTCTVANRIFFFPFVTCTRVNMKVICGCVSLDFHPVLSRWLKNSTNVGLILCSADASVPPDDRVSENVKCDMQHVGPTLAGSPPRPNISSAQHFAADRADAGKLVFRQLRNSRNAGDKTKRSSIMRGDICARRCARHVCVCGACRSHTCLYDLLDVRACA